MAAYTSAQAGNWSSTATWGGTGPPGSGDTATVAHAVAVTADATIGDGSNTTVLAVGTTSSSLSIAAGVRFTIAGNAAFGAYNGGTVRTYLTLAAGASLVLDSATGPVVTWTYDSKCVISGSSGSRCAINGRGGSGANGRFTEDSGGRNLNTAATCCDFSNLGDSSHFGWGICRLDTSGSTGTFDRCTFTGSGTAPYLGVSAGDAVASLTDCTWAGSAAIPWHVSSPFAKTGGTRLVSGCVTLGSYFTTGVATFDSQAGFTITGNYFDDFVQSNVESAPWAALDNNFIRLQYEGEHISSGDVGVGGGNYFYTDVVGGGSGILVTDFADFTIANNLFDISDAGSYGYAIGFTEASVNPRSSSVISGNVMTAATSQPWSLVGAVTNSGAPNPLVVAVTHNTAPATDLGVIAVGATGPGERAGSLSAVRDNLFWATGTNAYPVLAILNTGSSSNLDSGVVTDVVTAGNVTNNAYCSLGVQAATLWTVTHPASGATTCTDGTVYSTPMSGSTAPGAGDVHLGTATDAVSDGPKFVDPTRTLSAWAVHRGLASSGASTSTKVGAAFAAIRADRSLIADARDWVRAGFAPQNPALHNAAHDGTDIGAVAYQAASTTYPGAYADTSMSGFTAMGM